VDLVTSKVLTGFLEVFPDFDRLVPRSSSVGRAYPLRAVPTAHTFAPREQGANLPCCTKRTDSAGRSTREVAVCALYPPGRHALKGVRLWSQQKSDVRTNPRRLRWLCPLSSCGAGGDRDRRTIPVDAHHRGRSTVRPGGGGSTSGCVGSRQRRRSYLGDHPRRAPRARLGPRCASGRARDPARRGAPLPLGLPQPQPSGPRGRRVPRIVSQPTPLAGKRLLGARQLRPLPRPRRPAGSSASPEASRAWRRARFPAAERRDRVVPIGRPDGIGLLRVARPRESSQRMS
jgi:hypothetical protein